MRIATISQAKNGLSALLDFVRAGETVLIVDRGRPVARLEPAASIAEEAGGRLARLERAGIVRVGRRKLPADFLTRSLPRPRAGASVLAALLEERREGR